MNKANSVLDHPHRSEPHSFSWKGQMADDVGATDAPEPQATLQATREEIVISSPRGTHRIPRASITRITRGKMYPWFFGGIRIHHSDAELPRQLQFKPQAEEPKDLAATLRELGYPA